MQPPDVGHVQQVLGQPLKVGSYCSALPRPTPKEGNGLCVRPQARVNVPACPSAKSGSVLLTMMDFYPVVAQLMKRRKILPLAFFSFFALCFTSLFLSGYRRCFMGGSSNDIELAFLLPVATVSRL